MKPCARSTAYRNCSRRNSKETLNELNAGLNTKQLIVIASLVNELELKVESDFKDQKLVTIAGWYFQKQKPVNVHFCLCLKNIKPGHTDARN
jgi:hypothetical protein